MTAPDLLHLRIRELPARYAACAIVALACYEYLLMTTEECEFVWRRRWNIATWIFLINRYLVIVVAVMHFAPYTRQLLCRCHEDVRVFAVIQLLPYATTAVFSGLRVYALSDRNIVLSTLVVCLSLVPIPINSYVTARHMVLTQEFDAEYGSYCLISLDIPTRLIIELVIIVRLSVILADLLVLFITWKSTYSTYRSYKENLINRNIGLRHILLRDGSGYFLIFFALNLTQVAIKVSNNALAHSAVNPIVDVLDVLPAILVSRFIVDLRNADRPQCTPYTPPSRFSMPVFAMPHSPTPPDPFADDANFQSLDWDTLGREWASSHASDPGYFLEDLEMDFVTP